MTPGTSNRQAGLDPDASGVGAGDFVGLRAYRDGDPPHAVHWPTTARTGTPYVVERAGEADLAVEVEVHPAPTPAAWERELSVAVGEVERAFAAGRRVGLRIPAVGEELPRRLHPAAGGIWRRALLETLACLPRVP
jgi:uncharacterized protein (DUF58 family)